MDDAWVKQKLAELHARAPVKRKRKSFVADFVQVPHRWKKALRGASGSAYELALTILEEQHRIEHSLFPKRELKLSKAVTKMPSGTRDRARAELASRGLILVEWKGNQATVVTDLLHRKR